MPDQRLVVSDASPLIALERIGQLDLLVSLFGSLSIPPAVAREVFGGDAPPHWIDVRRPTSRVIAAGNVPQEVTEAEQAAQQADGVLGEHAGPYAFDLESHGVE